MLSAIVCMDNFGGIGKNGDLLYRIPDDLKRFKEITMGHSVIMGRKTWNSIGNKPLVGRKNYIYTNTLNFYDDIDDNGTLVSTLNSKECISTDFLKHSMNRYFVIGGGSIYKMLLPHCEKVYATIVNLGDRCISTADVFFPIEYLLNNFDEIESTDKTYGNLSYSFKTFVKKKNCNTVSNAYSDPVFGHDAVKNPSHYTGKKYEVISFIEDRGLGYCLGNVAKYICRAGKKYPGDSQKELQDLNKAKWYLERRLTEDNTVDVEDQKFKIDVNDFIEDQELNYNRGEIIRCISTWCADNVEVNLKISLALLDSEIHRMEDETA